MLVGVVVGAADLSGRQCPLLPGIIAAVDAYPAVVIGLAVAYESHIYPAGHGGGDGYLAAVVNGVGRTLRVVPAAGLQLPAEPMVGRAQEFCLFEGGVGPQAVDDGGVCRVKIQVPAGLAVHLRPVEPAVDTAEEPLFASQIDRIGLAGVVFEFVPFAVEKENLRPALPAVGAAIDAPVGGHEHLLGQQRVDLHCTHAAHGQPGRDQGPREAFVGGLVESAALRARIEDVGL